jgi:hypothetical protein
MTESHVVGPPITFHYDNGLRVRQRCSWCGKLISDVELSLIAVPIEDADKPLPTWQEGAIITMDGGMKYIVECDDGKVPDDACFHIDPAVTA